MRKTTKKDEITATEVIGATNETLATITDEQVISKYFYKNNPEEEIKTKIGIGVQKSYENPAVSAARKARSGVYMQRVEPVTGQPIGAPKHYSSMRYAYELGLGTLAGHIEFRGRVKKSSEPIRNNYGDKGSFLFSNAPVKLEDVAAAVKASDAADAKRA
jgi:hypothetical protein